MHIDPADWHFTTSPFSMSSDDLYTDALKISLQPLVFRNRQDIDVRPLTSLALNLDIPSWLSSKMTIDEWTSMRGLVASWKELDLYWDSYEDFPGASRVDVWNNILHVFATELSKVLRGATQLESLSLSCKSADFGPGAEMDGPLNLFDTTNPLHYPQLKKLSLGIEVPTEDLIQFLGRHTSTLKSLTLHNARVEDGSRLLRAIPEILKLERVSIESLGSDESELLLLRGGTDVHHTKVRDFLLGKTDTMPDPFVLDCVNPESFTAFEGDRGSDTESSL